VYLCIGFSDAQLLAPQEIYAKKGENEIAAKDEMSQSERKARFRRHKEHNAKQNKTKRDEEKKLGIHNKERDLRELKKAKNVTVMVTTKPDFKRKKHKRTD